ncbi:MAG: hypothetical protein PHU71_00265 [Candidatus Gracilibacteria bacterium]|nr:hypothetical protein [Candidatus Gracilibacteria bacterium]
MLNKVLDKLFGDLDTHEKEHRDNLIAKRLIPVDANGIPIKKETKEVEKEENDLRVHSRNLLNFRLLQEPRPIVANTGQTVLVRRQPWPQRIANALGVNFMNVPDKIVAVFSGETANRKSNYGALDKIDNPQPALVIETEDKYEISKGEPLYVRLYVNYVLDLCQGLKDQKERAKLANYYKFKFNDHSEWQREVALQISDKLEELIHKYSKDGHGSNMLMADVITAENKQKIQQELRDFLQGTDREGACSLLSIPRDTSVTLEQLDRTALDKAILKRTGGKSLEEYVREQCTSQGEEDAYDPEIGEKLTATILKSTEGDPEKISQITGKKSLEKYVRANSIRKGKKGVYDPVAGQRMTDTIMREARAEISGEVRNPSNSRDLDIYNRSTQS